MPTEMRRSVCPYDCPDTCGLLVEVEDGRAMRVSGDPEHPFTRGTLCPKMLHYEKTVHSPLRLTTPLVRIGPKGMGEFRAATWNEAVAIIAARWQEIISGYGAEAILPYSYAGTMGLVHRNCGHAFFHRLGASRLDRTICSPAKEAGWKAIMGDTPSPHPDEVAKSDLVILWGINAAATNIHFLHGVREARKRGAQVWLIDTYETPTAAAADRVILSRPGSDGALALGMMHVIAREGLIDKAFVEERVQGFAELAEQVLPGYPPERVSAMTGIPASVIEDMTRCYARAKAPFIRLGSGLSRYGNGAMTVRTICALPALVGAYGKRGGGLLASTSTGAAFAMKEVTREDFMLRPTRIVNMNRLGHALTELADPPVKSLYVYHSNPASVTPDQNAILRGLARNDLFTVVHERFMTDTARWADVVLPACSSLETGDVYRAYGTYCIQRAWPAIPPVGESRSNWDTFAFLAEAMGFDEPYFSQTEEEIIEHLVAIPAPMRDGIDLARFEEGKGVELPLAPDTPRTFRTPSGKVEILNHREPEPLPRHLPTHEEEGNLPLMLMTAPTLYALNASFYEQDELRERQGGMRLMVNPVEAETRGIGDGERVIACNERGKVEFTLAVTDRVPPGVAVAEGVWWSEHAPGDRTVNALTSQRLTDRGNGSTFYDTRIEIKAGTGDREPGTGKSQAPKD
ncbi:molybdopterin oxidoreductase family protein [Geobacter grbiciae]|uniref:molybdopterin oxidoreductase family protein n=1 Tax=Geobacter grbiciae TaxID=155042 RepID=UPI001C02B06B|nr:molybdopterin oxidoreductase family protein [Geobacter grbiciae]MBT1076909.1 molybdopterin oxidoreductase family protein [Geobacter grbiciae]